METNPTPEAQREIDLYLNDKVNKILYRKLVPTGVIAGIIGFFLSSFINESARNTAMERTFNVFSTSVRDVAKEIGKIEAEILTSKNEADESIAAMKILVNKNKKTKEELAVVLNQSSTANQIADALNKNKQFKEDILNLLKNDVKIIQEKEQGNRRQIENLKYSQTINSSQISQIADILHTAVPNQTKLVLVNSTALIQALGHGVYGGKLYSKE
ncbi:hypothetical protein [Tunicatimonas pelagia]|uniref:hypothetical protein n=1 Tax=Tunicatimonas pelagia TaxID=931531 RepID=UPI0026668C38|nr:hypothetical protein [Tunicatimonas pelagia]WKN41886.1 hypothetical protein P0M28_22865 [Tunicatimonas pelagia]